MGLQKFRADTSDTAPNGAIVWRTSWIGGPTLAKVANCPTAFGRRTVYLTGHPDTYFSVPAACTFRGRTIRGWLGIEDGNPSFHAYRDASSVFPFVDS